MRRPCPSLLNKKYVLLVLLCLSIVQPLHAEAPKVFFQSHRGGVNEVPENTLVALRHSWQISGAVPEVDLRTTSDGTIVCMHDGTPERTTNAPEEYARTAIDKIPLVTLRSWDAGSHFDGKYAGEKVPTLDEVIALLKEDSRRELYLDLKGVDLDQLVAIIKREKIEDRIIFVHGSPLMCRKLQGLYPGARTMTWLSGDPEKIQQRFADLKENKFKGISQLQFHLQTKVLTPEITYVFDTGYLEDAVAATRKNNVDFQLRPFDFNAQSLRYLIDLGVYWYVSDDPEAFARSVKEALAINLDR